MSADPHRRGFLRVFGAGTVAAAAGGASPHAIAVGRLRSGFAGAAIRGTSRAVGATLERAVPLDAETPAPLARLVADLDAAPATALEAVLGMPGEHALSHAACRAIAALAPVYPPEIAAYRSFGAPMRRWLYAELLARQSSHLAGPSTRPPTPPAPPGPDA